MHKNEHNLLLEMAACLLEAARSQIYIIIKLLKKIVNMYLFIKFISHPESLWLLRLAAYKFNE